MVWYYDQSPLARLSVNVAQKKSKDDKVLFSGSQLFLFVAAMLKRQNIGKYGSNKKGLRKHTLSGSSD